MNPPEGPDDFLAGYSVDLAVSTPEKDSPPRCKMSFDSTYLSPGTSRKPIQPNTLIAPIDADARLARFMEQWRISLGSRSYDDITRRTPTSNQVFRPGWMLLHQVGSNDEGNCD